MLDATLLAPDVIRGRVGDRLEVLQRVTGLPFVFGGPVYRDGAGERLVIENLRGNLGSALDGMSVDAGEGLGGLVLARRRPMVVRDYGSNSAITHRFDGPVVERERCTAVFAFPVAVHGRVQAVIYGASRGGHPIQDPVLRRASSVMSVFAREIEALVPAPKQAVAMTSAQALAELDAIAAMLEPDLRARLLRARRSLDAEPPMAHPAEGALAPRERECLSLAATGATNAQIAGQLGLSPETVKAYLRSAMRKLRANNRTGAIHLARAAGLI